MSAPKTQQLGKYQLLARLATGGMAEIYLARQHTAGRYSRFVVVKRILPHLAEEAHFVDMFIEEARLASQINHPNVVQIYDVDQYEASFYIAMEYIDGLSAGTLSRRGRLRKLLPPRAVVLELMAQACDGLQAAHELADESGTPLGLVHRDISPHNLMISRAGTVKIVDFGIAKAKTTAIKTRTGDIKGKYPYMSPEQVRAEELDRRSDIFSLGSVLSELLLGVRFFERGSELETLKAITEEPIPLMVEMDPSIPLALSDITARSLQRRREDRYQTAEEMGRAIRNALERLELRSSPQILADYLETDCRDLLEARSKAIREISQLSSTQFDEVPRVSGFDESASSQKPVSDYAKTLPRVFPSEPPTSGVSGSIQGTEETIAASAESGHTKRLVLAVSGVLLVALCSIVGVVLVRSADTPRGPALLFAHPPTHDVETVQKGLAPLATYLQSSLDRPVEIVVTKDYTSIGELLEDGEVHIANLGPLLFVQSRNRSPDLVPLAAHVYEGARDYQSYLVTRMDSDVQTVEDLEGRSFCYVDRGSTSGYLLPRRYLRRQGHQPDEFFGETRFSGNHEQVMEDIIEGRCAAGAVYSGAYSSASSFGVATSRLRLFGVAGQSPWDVVCASPMLSYKTALQIKRSLLEFDPERDLGRKIVSNTFRIDGFVAPKLEEFEPVRQAADAEGLLNARN